MAIVAAAVAFLAVPILAPQGAGEFDPSAWTKSSESLKVEVVEGKAVVQANGWAYLLHKTAHDHGEARLKFTVLEAAKTFNTGGHGGDWNAYRYNAYADGGYEVGVLLRATGEESGYRVQLSTAYQEVSLLKYPLGSFVRVAPCALKLNQPHELYASVQGNEIGVKVDGRELIRYADPVLPLEKGGFGIGAGSSARVAFEAVVLKALPPKAPADEKPHSPDFAVRNWRGQPWVFDGQEPILLLYSKHQSCNQNVKLKPGFRPVLLWDAAWGLSNGGEIKELACTLTEPKAEGKGAKLTLRWEGKTSSGVCETRTRMVVGYDGKRKMYAYDVDSELEVFKDFRFRYGFDFEHHTPLGPYYSKYFVVKMPDGRLHYRSVSPIDPGGFSGLAKKGGLRMWHGRTNEPVVVASPAVEYDIPEAEKRATHTAVCACMYDTGIAFPSEDAKAGTKISVRYRYTGYPPEEAERVYKASTVYPLPSLDPNRHLIFAGYPKTTFADFLPLDQPWWGRRPFVSGHNRLPPRYYLEKNTGSGSGFAMRLGPGGSGAASLPTPAGPLPQGRYVVSARAKGENLFGPGAFIEAFTTDQQLVHGYTGGYVRTSTKVLKEEKHYVGNGSFDWKRVGFVTELLGGAPAVAVGFGNEGTGDVWFADLEILPLKEGEKVPDGILPKANARGAAVKAAPAGALADYRMEEGKGVFVHDYAGTFGPLELSNVEWVKDGGRPVLKLADYQEGRTQPAACDGNVGAYFYSSPSYKSYAPKTVFAFGGALGGHTDRKSFSLCVETKPSARMLRKPAYWGTDIAGLGGRAVKLIINNDGKLAVMVHFKEYVVSDVAPEPDRWYHLAVTGEAKGDEKLKIRLYVNGKLAKEAVSQHFSAVPMGDHLILGAEVYYLDGAYYGGLFGRVTAYGRALGAQEIEELSKAFK